MSERCPHTAGPNAGVPGYHCTHCGETEPSADLVPYEELPEEVEIYAEVVDGETVEDASLNAAIMLAGDLQDALNFIRQYQRVMSMLYAPDPNGHDAQLLLQKYNMNHKRPKRAKRKLNRGDDDRSLSS